MSLFLTAALRFYASKGRRYFSVLSSLDSIVLVVPLFLFLSSEEYPTLRSRTLEEH